MQSMSQAPAPSALPAHAAAPAPLATVSQAPPLFTTPTWLDFVLILLGVVLSLYLTNLAEVRVFRSTATPSWLGEGLAQAIPAVLLLPIGIYLWWPIFYSTARFRGRSENLTLVEYLWGTAWLIDLVVIGLIVGKHWEINLVVIDQTTIRSYASWGLLIIATGLAILGTLGGMAGLVQRTPRPWTHHLGIALMLWPVLPLLLIWIGRLRLE